MRIPRNIPGNQGTVTIAACTFHAFLPLRLDLRMVIESRRRSTYETAMFSRKGNA